MFQFLSVLQTRSASIKCWTQLTLQTPIDYRRHQVTELATGKPFTPVKLSVGTPVTPIVSPINQVPCRACAFSMAAAARPSITPSFRDIELCKQVTVLRGPQGTLGLDFEKPLNPEDPYTITRIHPQVRLR